MRRMLIILAVSVLLIIPPFMACGNTSRIPDYSLEGVTPKVEYYEWVEEYSGWRYLGEDSSDAKNPVKMVETFRLDRNKDGVCDMKITKSYVPEKTQKGKGGRKVVDPAYQTMTVMIDDDFDKLWDRRLSDDADSSGKPGMDGVFEEEEAVRY
ncbi:hypothetical protein FJZ53_02150 [Candidatus Woesearchaeota archaeon]|nr:hypothetical protein [Candidatus Woesearchaeota archaeon]